MWNTKTCVVCFNTQCKLYKIEVGQLKNEFYEVSGLKEADMEGHSQYLCVECTAYTKHFMKFRHKCNVAHSIMVKFLKTNILVTEAMLKSLHHQQLNSTPSLSYIDLKNINYEIIKSLELEPQAENSLNCSMKYQIPIFYCSTDDNLESEFDTPRKKIRTMSPVKEELDDIFAFNIPAIDNDEMNIGQENAEDEEEYVDSDDNLSNDNEVCDLEVSDIKEEKDKTDEDSLEQEYATITPLSMNEAKAVMEVGKLFVTSNLQCKICGKGYQSKSRLNYHMRLHDQHTSGLFKCELCFACYKTEFLLTTHMNEKHLYKYVCKKCPEVSFDRVTAKQHYVKTHLWGSSRNPSNNWAKNRPSWLCNKGIKSDKVKRERKEQKYPDDFPVLMPISQEEQYRLMELKKDNKNYRDSQFKCEFCYKGFLAPNTYNNHMRVHDPTISGHYQCDMCKMYFVNARKVYQHIKKTHLFKYSCQVCNYVCTTSTQARAHYQEHKNITFTCPQCGQEFKKNSTLLTHVRVKHPSTHMCPVCGHSFVSEYGVTVHQGRAHTPQEVEESKLLKAQPGHPNYCSECEMQFLTAAAYVTHLGSSNKHSHINVSSKPDRRGLRRVANPRKRRQRGRPRGEILNEGVPTASNCDVCDAYLLNDVVAKKHYEAEHPGTEFLKRYMCDVCGHTTKQHANLVAHMRTHTREKPFACPHCDRRFATQSNRATHLVVHTGEKKHACQHCGRRFTQAASVRLHIQTVHLKIPYPPWDKKNRRRRKELANASLPYCVE